MWSQKCDDCGPERLVLWVATPTVGLPTVTSVGVELDADGVPVVRAVLNRPAPNGADPLLSPVLQEAEFKFENNQPVVFLTGSNFEIPLSHLKAEFYVGNEVYEGTVLPELSGSLGDNRYRLAVTPPKTVALGTARIGVTRTQKEQIGPQSGDDKDVDYESNRIRLEAETEYVFAALRFADQVAVLRGDSTSVAQSLNSQDLLVARIPVGSGTQTDDWPRALAVTHDGSRAYVVLEKSAQVAVLDPIVLQQIDVNPATDEVDAIRLPAGVSPRAISISSRDQYAYVVGTGSNYVYVIDAIPTPTPITRWSGRFRWERHPMVCGI